ncbi:MAG: AMIN domain-containing protein, partial [Rhodocyclaceae bacterium]|nr:AMIN domain-containing protein [Rhodocyclaceae bacterium]
MSGQSAPSPSPLKPSGERLAAVGMTRRGLFRCAGAVLAMMVSPVGMAGTSRMVAARVWPAEEYTRVTLESAADVKFTSMVLRGPDRLVVDLQDVTLDSVLRSLPEKVLKDDPLVQRIRVGDFRPGVVRIVFDLKTEVKPQLFMLKPIANYGHRLVVDIYPANPPDPLLALIEKFSPTDAAEGG